MDCPFMHYYCGVETRARGMEKSARCRAMCSGRTAVVFVCKRSDASVFYGTGCDYWATRAKSESIEGEWRFSKWNCHAGSWNEARESLFLLCTRVGIRATSLLAVT